MSKLYIARKTTRKAVMLPLGGTKARPNIIIPLYKLDNSELDELVEAVLEKRNLKYKKAEIVELTELGYEHRRKTAEVSKELRKRIAEQAEFPKLKWGGLRPPKHR